LNRTGRGSECEYHQKRQIPLSPFSHEESVVGIGPGERLPGDLAISGLDLTGI
jgi:hypothetical protein